MGRLAGRVAPAAEPASASPRIAAQRDTDLTRFKFRAHAGPSLRRGDIPVLVSGVESKPFQTGLGGGAFLPPVGAEWRGPGAGRATW